MESHIELDGDENLNFNRIGDKQNDSKRFMTIQPKTGATNLGEENVCKICLSEDEPENPLICPCACIGSVRYIHVKCIQEWLESKKHKKMTQFVNSYIWRGLECEICKAPYKDMVPIPNSKKVASLLKFDTHEDAERYMIIESVTNSSSKTIHVINFSAA
jgi:hypothetical protein